MLTYKKQALLVAIFKLEMFITGYLSEEKEKNLLNSLLRNINSLRAIIKRA